jgi:hypothetical protein
VKNYLPCLISGDHYICYSHSTVFGHNSVLSKHERDTEEQERTNREKGCQIRIRRERKRNRLTFGLGYFMPLAITGLRRKHNNLLRNSAQDYI